MGKNVCKKCDNLSNILGFFLQIPLNSEFIKVEEENTSVIASSAEPSQTESVPKQKFLWDFFTRAIPSLTLLPRQHAVAPAGRVQFKHTTILIFHLPMENWASIV